MNLGGHWRSQTFDEGTLTVNFSVRGTEADWKCNDRTRQCRRKHCAPCQYRLLNCMLKFYFHKTIKLAAPNVKGAWTLWEQFIYFIAIILNKIKKEKKNRVFKFDVVLKWDQVFSCCIFYYFCIKLLVILPDQSLCFSFTLFFLFLIKPCHYFNIIAFCIWNCPVCCLVTWWAQHLSWHTGY